MTEKESVGYTKEEYYKISSKHGLPKRCPILRKCCRAVLTRYEMGFKIGGNKMKFEEFLHSEDQLWEPEKMIKEIERITWSHTHDVLTSVENVCPEVTLFEPYYLHSKFRQSAFGEARYFKDTRHYEAEAKHFSECAEFSEYIFQSSDNNIKGFGMKMPLNHISEKELEDYLVNNLDALEPGLKFVDRQKSIGKWVADIFASDSLGNDVLVELKSRKLDRSESHMLTGQVSKYFNSLKKKAQDLRMIIVLPRSNKKNLDDLFQGIQHWIENEKASIYTFDYFLYDKKFIFSKVTFN